LGIEKEKRSFSPHITIARLKNVSLNSKEQEFLLKYKFPNHIRPK